ncbi:MAG: hypothetical protein H6722_17990 [Sandaracinus sp.]|nr:hypothetical protein [Sandaracinus sp.]
MRNPLELRALGLLAVTLVACEGGGAPPPPGRLHFPTAIALSPQEGDQSRFLFVSSSNWDLRYLHGSLATYDLDVLNRELDAVACAREERESCGILPSEDPRDDLDQTRIRPVEGLLVSEVYTGSYAAGLAVSEPRTADSAWRLYLPVRSDADLTHVDVDANGRLRCGDAFVGPGAPVECRDAFRSGDDETANLRGLSLPPDPVSIHVGPLSDVATSADPSDGSYVMLAHRGGAVSLFFDAPVGESTRPRLVHVLEGLAEELSDVTVDPITKLAWLPSSFEPRIARAGIAFDGQASAPERSFLFDGGSLFVNGAVDTGTASRGDTRAVRFDPRPDVRRAYVLSRTPRALLTVDVDDSLGLLQVVDVVPVGSGPAKLQLAEVPTASGDRVLAFVTCFNSADLYVIDVDTGLLLGVVRAIGGPFDLAVDVARQRLYVADFRQSVLRVFDLSGTFACLSPSGAESPACAPVPLGVVGRPLAVQELR